METEEVRAAGTSANNGAINARPISVGALMRSLPVGS